MLNTELSNKLMILESKIQRKDRSEQELREKVLEHYKAIELISFVHLVKCS